MSRIVQFPKSAPSKFGFKKAVVKKGRKKINLEDFGQLNLFDQGKEARVININPNMSSFEEALLLDEQGRWEGALELYQKAVEGKDHTADAYCNMGIIFSNNSDSRMAIDAFTKCLKTDPRHFEAHYNLANLFSDIGNIDLAKVHYQMSVTINPEFSNGYYNLGLVLATNREYPEAIEAFVKYKETAPMNEKENAMELIRNIHQSIGDS